MSLNTSYTPNYFAIDDILATQERIPCKFLKNVPKLGKLNSSSEDDDLKAGTVLELPAWLVLELASGRDPVVAPDLPKNYKEAYREILKADPWAVDLHKFGLYYYELGAYVKHLDPRGELANTLLETFQTRFVHVMALADNTVLDPMVQERMDTLERRLFREGQKTTSKLNSWLKESDTTLEAAEMVSSHKKRKRVELEDLL